MDLPFFREYDLPWTTGRSQDKKFQRLLGIVFLVCVFLSAVWPFIPVPEPDPFDVEEIPPRIAQLLLEEKPLPPPPPPVVEEEPEPEPEVDEPEPEQVVEEVPEPEPERNERSMITSKVGAASGGINTANMSRNTGGSGIAGRSTTRVASPVAGIGQAGASASRSGSSGKASRSREEIELVFDKNKGAIFALYNRALRRDPSLEGKLVLRLTIDPNGAVSFCEIVSSELGDSELERKLVQRVKLFRFEARDVEAITTTKPIDFFPA